MFQHLHQKICSKTNMMIDVRWTITIYKSCLGLHKYTQKFGKRHSFRASCSKNVKFQLYTLKKLKIVFHTLLVCISHRNIKFSFFIKL